MSNLVEASMGDFTGLVGLVFDIINIKNSLYNASKKPKKERNTVLEDILSSIHHVCNIYNNS